MKFIMEELFDGKKVNSHNIGTGLQKDLYRWIVNTAKQLVFEDCLELLKYASWEENPEVYSNFLIDMNVGGRGICRLILIRISLN